METIEQLVDGVINERLAERQFDETDLTFRQLHRIAESFKVTLRGVYHPRIAYPEPTEAELRATGGAAAAGAIAAAPRRERGETPVDGGASPDAASPGEGERPA